VQVWRYQLRFDDLDLLDDDDCEGQADCTSQGGCRYRAASSKVEVIERFIFPYRSAYSPMLAASSPRTPCDPHEASSRWFLEETRGSYFNLTSTSHNTGDIREWGAPLVRYTILGDGENAFGTGGARRECLRQALVTTIIAHSMDEIKISGYCAFSGRAVYSEVGDIVWRAEDPGYYELLENTVFQDFLNS